MNAKFKTKQRIVIRQEILISLMLSISAVIFGADMRSYYVDKYGCTSNRNGLHLGNMKDNIDFELMPNYTNNGQKLTLTIRANAFETQSADSVLWGVIFPTGTHYIKIPVLESMDTTSQQYIITPPANMTIEQLQYDVEVGVANYTFSCEVKQMTSNHQVIAEEEVVLFPNPAHSTVSIKKDDVHKISFHDLSGRVVLYKTNFEGHIIDISSLKVGIYIVITEGASQDQFFSTLVIE